MYNAKTGKTHTNGSQKLDREDGAQIRESYIHDRKFFVAPYSPTKRKRKYITKSHWLSRTAAKWGVHPLTIKSILQSVNCSACKFNRCFSENRKRGGRKPPDPQKLSMWYIKGVGKTN